MHLGPWARASIAVAALLASARAEAQDLEPRAVFLSSLGYNDNVTNTPKYPKVGSSTQVGDGFWSVSPALSLTYETPEATHRLAYVFDARFNFTYATANTYGNKLAYLGTFHVTPRTTLDLGANAKEGRLGSLVSSNPATETEVESLPVGLFTYVDLSANDKVTHELSALTRVYQKAAFLERFPLTDSSSIIDPSTAGLNRRARGRVNADVGTGLEHDLDFDTLGADVDLGYLYAVDEARYINTLTASWTHSFDRLHVPGLSSRLDVGLSQTMRTKDLGSQLLQPTLTATVSFDLDDTRASVVYLHAPKANLVNGVLNLVDSVTMRAGVPLVRTKELQASGSAAWQQNKQVGESGDIGDPQNVLLFDAQLAYSPLNRTFSTFTFTLRGQRRVQLQMPLPRPGFLAFDGSENDTVLFSVSVAYPAKDNYRAPFVLAPYRPEPSGPADVEGDAGATPPETP